MFSAAQATTVTLIGRQPAGVEGDALADEHDVGAAAAVPAGLDDARRSGRALPDGGHAAPALGAQLLLVPDADGEALEQGRGAGGQPGRGLVQRRRVDQVAGDRGGRDHRLGLRERRLEGVDVADDHGDGAQRPRLGGVLQREAVDPEQQPLGQPLQAGGVQRQPPQVERQRRGALAAPGDRRPGLAQRGRRTVPGADQEDQLGGGDGDDLAGLALGLVTLEHAVDVEVREQLGAAVPGPGGHREDVSPRDGPGQAQGRKVGHRLGHDGLEGVAEVRGLLGVELDDEASATLQRDAHDDAATFLGDLERAVARARLHGRHRRTSISQVRHSNAAPRGACVHSPALRPRVGNRGAPDPSGTRAASGLRGSSRQPAASSPPAWSAHV
jgi:hypothetical protein